MVALRNFAPLRLRDNRLLIFYSFVFRRYEPDLPERSFYHTSRFAIEYPSVTEMARANWIYHELARHVDQLGFDQAGSNIGRYVLLESANLRDILGRWNGQAPPRAGIGCGGRNRPVYLPILDENNFCVAYWHCEEPRAAVDSNDCLIACFQRGYFYAHGQHRREQMRTIRKRLGLEPGAKLQVEDAKRLADDYGLVVRVRQSARTLLSHVPMPLATTAHLHDESWFQRMTVEILIENDHAYLLRRQVGRCLECGQPMTETHEHGFQHTAPCPHCRVKHETGDMCPLHPEALPKNQLVLEKARLLSVAYLERQRFVDVDWQDDVWRGMLDEQQFAAVAWFTHGQSICLTGQGGTGKTYWLRWLRDKNRALGLKVLMTASTGRAAAFFDEATTIHSAFGILPTDTDAETVLKRMSAERRTRLFEADVWIVDEISMVTGFMIDLVDDLMRNVKQQLGLPFGGMRVAFVGDMMQLPPVDEELDFVFDSRVMQYMLGPYGNMSKLEFTHSYRFTDELWFLHLQKIRTGSAALETLAYLQERTAWTFEHARDTCVHRGKTLTILTPFNKKRVQWNRRLLAEMPGEARSYLAEGNCLAHDQRSIELKVGAPVMMLSNSHMRHGIANGSLGRVTQLNDEDVAVDWGSGRVIVIGREGGSFDSLQAAKQLPLTLAFAITIHKAQGATIEAAYVDLSARMPFCFHLLYVALSRVPSAQDLFLSRLPELDALNFVNMRCLEFTKLQRGRMMRPLEWDADSGECYSSFSGPELMNSALSIRLVPQWRRRREAAYESKISQQSWFVAAEYEKPATDELLFRVRVIHCLEVAFGTPTLHTFPTLEAFGDFVMMRIEAKRDLILSPSAEPAARNAARLPWRLCTYHGGFLEYHNLLEYLTQHKALPAHFQINQMFHRTRVLSLQIGLRQRWRTTVLESHDLAPFLPDVTLDEACLSLAVVGTAVVERLYALYGRLDQACQSLVNASILDFSSAGQLSRYGMLKHLPPEAVYNPGNTRFLIVSKLHRPHLTTDDWIRQAIYGGRVLTTLSYYNSAENEDDDLAYLDCNSMYASVMHDEAVPYGPCQLLTEEQIAALMASRSVWNVPHFDWRSTTTTTPFFSPFWIVDCEVDPTGHNMVPMLPRHDASGRLCWDLLPRRGWYTSIDLFHSGARVQRIYNGIVWMAYGPILQPWIAKLLKGRLQYRESNPPLASVCKLLANATFGDFGKRQSPNVVRLAYSEEDLRAFRGTANWESVIYTPHATILFGVSNKAPKVGNSARHLTAFILAMARAKYSEMLSLVCPSRYSPLPRWEDMPLYGDTDSILLRRSRASNLTLGTEPGQWKEELGHDARISEFVCLEPRVYGLRYRFQDGVLHERLRTRSVPIAQAEWAIGSGTPALVDFEHLAQVARKLAGGPFGKTEAVFDVVRRSGANPSDAEIRQGLVPFELYHEKRVHNFYPSSTMAPGTAGTAGWLPAGWGANAGFVS